jgi:hypothetical protein
MKAQAASNMKAQAASLKRQGSSIKIKAQAASGWDPPSSTHTSVVVRRYVTLTRCS